MNPPIAPRAPSEGAAPRPTTRAWWQNLERTGVMVVLILILALLTRLPALAHPPNAVFDEAIHAIFVLHTIAGEPYFDIHPPLTRLLFAAIAEHFPFDTSTVAMSPYAPFGEFPYLPIRLAVLCFGVLLPLVIYGIGRQLGYRPLFALVAPLCVIVDNAFTVYARTMLPDTPLLFFGFLGILALLAALSRQRPSAHWGLVLLSGLALGAAVATKWTALGLFGVAAIIAFSSRRYVEIVVIAGIIVVVYVASFALFFAQFPDGGALRNVLVEYDVPRVTGLALPKGLPFNDPPEFSDALIDYHQAMLHANTDPDILAEGQHSGTPLLWITAKLEMRFWANEAGRMITLKGNPLLWSFALFALIFEVAWIAAHAFRDRVIAVDRAEALLLIGYAANLLPFFFIDRPMYLYHYFVALIFLFLLLPRVIGRLWECIVLLTDDRRFASAFLSFVGFLVIVNFLLLAPTTYGF